MRQDTEVPATRVLTLGLLCLPLAFVACGGGQKGSDAKPAATQTAAAPASPLDELPPALLDQLPVGIREAVGKTMTGDLDEMLKARTVRIGVTYNRTHYFIDKGVQRGVVYDYGRFLEDQINAKFATGNIKVFVIFVPLPREQLLRALIDGKVDMVAAQVTVLPELEMVVDFTNPTRRDIDEIVVTAKGTPAVTSAEDLSGREVLVRRSSKFRLSLLELNDTLKAKGKPPVDIQDAPENLDDDDLLEMVNAGLIPATIADNYLAKFWSRVFTEMVVYDKVAVRTGGVLAVAIRKNSPQLKAGLNKFMANYGLETAFGRQIERRYLVSTKYVKSATAEADRKKFMALIDIFRKYGQQYDMDYLLMAAQGYQESALNHEARSPVGAIGVMQVMPATGAELNVGDITQLEPNINAGVKYMRFVIDQYFKNEPMTSLDKGLFAFAAYNCGPGRVAQLRKEAAKRGFDPNVWFGNVEVIASERIGRETVTYVGNIYKYYVAYKLVMEENERRAATKAGVKK
jgi:membrane-bound lytic murein transglycosylase MltF